MSKKQNAAAKVLLLDIETSPLEVYCWGLFDQNIGLNMIKEDWSVLSYSAKWLDDSKMYYEDNRNSKNVRDDKKLLKGIWDLLDQADVVVGQNSDRFDLKKLNARFIKHEMGKPSPYRTMDTLKMAKKSFAFTSNKLEYMSSNLAPDQKKSSHKKFPGMELWTECLNGNTEAWKEMEKYNKQDVFALEAVYKKLAPWGVTVNFDIYNDQVSIQCNCGSFHLTKRGYAYSKAGKFAKLQCQECGAWHQDKQNLLTKEKKASLLK